VLPGVDPAVSYPNMVKDHRGVGTLELRGIMYEARLFDINQGDGEVVEDIRIKLESCTRFLVR
jgi:hypothetical protein